MDNRWVVPYNPYLLAKFDYHMNVEICSTVKAVKYLYKYVYKGHDRISFAVTNTDQSFVVDEITAFQSARWVSAPEAAWRIFRFWLCEIHPNVVPLQIHLPNMQAITFHPSESLEDIARDEQRKKTILTAFFERNQHDEYARTLLYQQFPEHYVWKFGRNSKIWKPQQKGFAVGRLVYANPSEGERYYLRLLLANVRGLLSFDDLFTVDGIRYSSFRETSYRRRLLEEDNSIELCMEEASQYQVPFVLRRLFATLLIYCQPENPKHLWDKFFPALS